MSIEHDVSGVADVPVAPSPPRCPFIGSADGAWVAETAHQDHRCAAVRPPAPLALAKQRRLCLTSGHVGCVTYVAALEARQAIVGPRETVGPWAWVRTTPVVDVNVGRGALLAGLLTDRRGLQVIPAVALVAALGALGLSSLGSSGARPDATPSASFAAIASPTVVGPTATTPVATASSPPPSVEASPTTTPVPTPSPTVVVTPSPTPAPSATTSYTVKSGDTLYDIAIKFNTTVTAIRNLNHLTSNTLHVGQVLLIP